MVCLIVLVAAVNVTLSYVGPCFLVMTRESHRGAGGARTARFCGGHGGFRLCCLGVGGCLVLLEVTELSRAPCAVVI